MASLVVKEFRQIVRGLIARPGFSTVIILSLVFGVAASTTTFYAVDRFLLHPLDVDRLEQLVELSFYRQKEGELNPISYPRFLSLRRSAVLADLAVFSGIELTLGGGEAVEQVDGEVVSPNYFDLLGVGAPAGRTFRPEDSGEAVTVLSWHLWKRRFGGDFSILGRVVQLNGQAYTVIGVAAETFRGLRLAEPVDLWIPVETFPRVATGFMAQIPVLQEPGIRWLEAVGRLPSGVSRESATETLTDLGRRLETESAGAREEISARLTPLSVTAVGTDSRQKIKSLLQLLAVLVFLELAITSSNLSGMFLVRVLQHRREAAIRFSLGASRLNLMARLMAEALMLTLVGTALGLGLAKILLGYLGRLEVPGMPVLTAPGAAIGPAHFAFAALVAGVIALSFSVPSTWRLSRLGPAEALKASSVRSGDTRVDLRRALIVAQVAIALVLLVGTGLFVRSLGNVWAANPGFRTADVLDVEVNLGPPGYTESRAATFYRELRERLVAESVFAEAAWAAKSPLGRGKIELGIEVPGRTALGVREQVRANVVGPGYFETLDIPIKAGRAFTTYDRANTRGVAMVSAAMASRFWPGENAVGKRIVLPGFEADGVEVVGVAADIKVDNLDEEPMAFLYLPVAQQFGLVGLRRIHLLGRTSGHPEAAIPRVRSRLRDLDPAVAMLSARSLRRAIRQRFGTQQLGVLVLGMLSLFAVIMVAAGIYGLLASVVAQQKREISVRMALGAAAGQVRKQIIGRTLLPVLAGIVIGITAALALLQLATSLLFGIAPLDLPSFAAALTLLLSISFLASYLPARHASRIDPAMVLREE